MPLALVIHGLDVALGGFNLFHHLPGCKTGRTHTHTLAATSGQESPRRPALLGRHHLVIQPLHHEQRGLDTLRLEKRRSVVVDGRDLARRRSVVSKAPWFCGLRTSAGVPPISCETTMSIHINLSLRPCSLTLNRYCDSNLCVSSASNLRSATPNRLMPAVNTLRSVRQARVVYPPAEPP